MHVKSSQLVRDVYFFSFIDLLWKKGWELICSIKGARGTTYTLNYETLHERGNPNKGYTKRVGERKNSYKKVMNEYKMTVIDGKNLSDTPGIPIRSIGQEVSKLKINRYNCDTSSIWGNRLLRRRYNLIREKEGPLIFLAEVGAFDFL